MAFTVEKIDDLLHVTLFHNVAVFMITGTLRAEHLPLLQPVIDDLLRRQPYGVAVASLVAPGMPALRLEMREPLRELVSRYGERMRLVLPIIDDSGIFAAARRAFMRGLLLLLGRANVDMAVSLEDAAAKLARVAQKSEGDEVPERELLNLLRFCAEHVGDAHG